MLAQDAYKSANSRGIKDLSGVFTFTYAAKFSLHDHAAARGAVLANLVHQSRQFQCIGHPEECAPLTEDDLRIGSSEIRPLRRNRADRDFIDSEQQAPSVPVVSLTHARQFLAVKRMERMRDAHKMHSCV
jgi:hypothetical protein